MGSPPHYVCFEGVESTGKSAQIPLVQSHLASLGFRCTVISEFPSEGEVITKITSALRKSIFISEGFPHGPESAFFYMLYADSLRRKGAECGADILLQDRGIDSSAIYQGYFAAKEHSCFPIRLRDSIEDLYHMLGIRLPDMIIVFQASIDVIKQRFMKREVRELTEIEIVRIQELQHAYETLAKRSERYRIVNADDLSHQVTQTIVGHILESRSPSRT